jgi:hypothetical protein
MSDPPKTPQELRNELLLNSNPAELLKTLGKESPSLDDHITNDIDISRVRQSVKGE